MIRGDTVANFRRIDDLAAFARRYPQRIATIAQTTFKEQSPSLLEPLRAYPQQRAVHPFVWSLDPVKNARGRRGFWARVRVGEIRVDGYGYVRTGALAAGYSVDMTVTSGEVLIFVRNKANRAYRYTKGRRQIPGHETTGWEKDAPIIEAWVGDYSLYLINQARLVKTAVGG